MGEYQEVLKPIFEEGALELVFYLLLFFKNDKYALSDILRMVLIISIVNQCEYFFS